jgi:hypothetical protein
MTPKPAEASAVREIYELFRCAAIRRQPVAATYDGQPRLLCPPAAFARPSIYAAKRFSCGPGAERRDPTKQFYIKMFFCDPVVLTPLFWRRASQAVEVFLRSGRFGKRGMLVEVDSVRRVFTEESGNAVRRALPFEKETSSQRKCSALSSSLNNGQVPAMARCASRSDWTAS